MENNDINGTENSDDIDNDHIISGFSIVLFLVITGLVIYFVPLQGFSLVVKGLIIIGILVASFFFHALFDVALKEITKISILIGLIVTTVLLLCSWQFAFKYGIWAKIAFSFISISIGFFTGSMFSPDKPVILDEQELTLTIKELNHKAKTLAEEAWQHNFLWDKNYAKAKALLEHALEKDSEHLDSLINLGTVLCDTGRHRESVEYFKKSIALNSEDRHAHYNLAVAIINYSTEEEAAEYFKQAKSMTSNCNTWEAFFDPMGH